MENYPGNSRMNKETGPTPPEPTTRKKLDPVVEGDVIRRKKPLGKRFAEVFVTGDGRSVWNYVVFDVLVPAAKDMASDAVSQGIERMLFGESRSGRGRGGHSRPSGSNGYVSYNRFAPGTSRREEARPISRQARTNHEFDEIILDSRVQADEVLERLFDLIGEYKVATVSDLYDLVGITPSYTDANWGWDDLRGARVIKAGGGFLLDLPKTKPVD